MLDDDMNYICIENVSKENQYKWKKFLKNKSKKYSEVEGIWRRTQVAENKKNSGYKTKEDKRRKILHYIDRYKINKSNQLVLSEMYLWISLAFPEKEINKFLQQVEKGIREGGWIKKKDGYVKDNLTFKIAQKKYYKEDKESNRIFPSDYKFLDVCFKSKDMKVPVSTKRNPWDVLKTGIRKKDARGAPQFITNIKKIKKYFPAQIEVGCGPSIECGISPLHYLHEVYNISEKESGKFILDPDKDTILYEVLSSPYGFFKKSTKMYRQLVLAEPNISYLTIKELFDKGFLIGDVLTNNFDKIPSTLKLREKYLRRYDESHIVPEMNFKKAAKSLLVVGVHADRRKVQAAARKKGLKIIYIDPEGYFEAGKWRRYPMESPQDDDIIISKRACEAFPIILKELTEGHNDRSSQNI